MTSAVLYIILIVTIIVSIQAFSNEHLKNRLMYIPYDVKHHQNYIRVLGHTLIHADYMHLAFNMMTLYFLGSALLAEPFTMYGVEVYKYVGVNSSFIGEYGPIMGQFHFVALYVVGALFATMIPYARHQDNMHYRSLGASGAVSSIVFATMLWNPTMELNIMFIPVAIPAFILGPLYLLFEFVMDKRGNTGIAHDAHIGGAVFGIIYVLIINIDKGKEFFQLITEYITG